MARQPPAPIVPRYGRVVRKPRQRTRRPHPISAQNLPVQLTSFIGREQAIVEVRTRLAQMRLLTLTGPGGSGKSRLALQVAGVSLEAWADGVWLVELAALTDPALVPIAVASVFRVREERGRPLIEQLIDHLRAKEVLIVLDNCEHLIDACASLVDTILRSCPGVRILATSRQRLGVAGEMVWRVPSLSLPQIGTAVTPAELTESESVRLFADRARLIQPDFVMTRRNLPDVAAICQHLDGMPLAIELAAARLGTLGLKQILEHLNDRFGLLTQGNRVGAPRQRTLKATLDWSHELLSEAEKVLFRRLSVFVGGFDRKAAAAVCAGGAVSYDGVLSLVTSLAEKSLLTADRDTSGAVRFRLLETMRQYGQDRLLEADEVSECRRRHADHYLALAKQEGTEYDRPDRWLDLVEEEHENCLAALDWAGGTAPQLQVSLAAALGPFWFYRGQASEGRFWLDRSLTGPCRATVSGVQALLSAGNIAWRRQGDLVTARRLFEESLDIARRLGESALVSRSLERLGWVAFCAIDYTSARRMYGQASRVAEKTGDRELVASIKMPIAILDLFERHYAAARARLSEDLVRHRRLGSSASVSIDLQWLGMIASEERELADAHRLLDESLTLKWKGRDTTGLSFGLDAYAILSAAEARPQRALRLEGCALALRERDGNAENPNWRARIDHWLEPQRKLLGRKAAAQAEVEGRALTAAEGLAYALHDQYPRKTQEAREVASPGGLTRREREIAVLMARGHTNREIADRLVIASRTVDAHAEHIRNKLGVRSRAEIAAWAAQELPEALPGAEPSSEAPTQDRVRSRQS